MRVLVFVFVAIISMAGAAKADQVWLTMDQVRPYKLKGAAESIVVGNPAIADVQVRDNENLLLFGKAPGLTNIYIFNAEGETVDNLIIRVNSSNSSMLTLHRGVERMTFNCTNNCDRTVTVGDDSVAFQQMTQQVQGKFQQAVNAAGESK